MALSVILNFTFLAECTCDSFVPIKNRELLWAHAENTITSLSGCKQACLDENDCESFHYSSSEDITVKCFHQSDRDHYETQQSDDFDLYLRCRG